MKKKVVSYLICNIQKSKHLSTYDIKKIKYGLEGLYSLITKTFILLLLAILLDAVKEFLLFMLFYVPLRTFAFGFHAKNNLQCWIYSVPFMLIPTILAKYIPFNNQVMMLLFSSLLLIIFSPADTEKRPLIIKKKRIINKIIIFIITASYVFTYIYFNDYNFIRYIYLAVIIEAFLTSPALYYITNQGYANYKKYREEAQNVF